jgi:hypothetical protein
LLNCGSTWRRPRKADALGPRSDSDYLFIDRRPGARRSRRASPVASFPARSTTLPVLGLASGPFWSDPPARGDTPAPLAWPGNHVRASMDPSVAIVGRLACRWR